MEPAATDAEMTRLRRFGSEMLNWAIRLMIVGSFLFVWRMYEQQQRFLEIQLKMDGRITQIERDLTFRIIQIERDLARVEGNMVTIETLKRMELYVNMITERLGITGRIDLQSPGRK